MQSVRRIARLPHGFVDYHSTTLASISDYRKSLIALTAPVTIARSVVSIDTTDSQQLLVESIILSSSYHHHHLKLHSLFERREKKQIKRYFTQPDILLATRRVHNKFHRYNERNRYKRFNFVNTPIDSLDRIVFVSLSRPKIERESKQNQSSDRREERKIRFLQ